MTSHALLNGLRKTTTEDIWNRTEKLGGNRLVFVTACTKNNKEIQNKKKNNELLDTPNKIGVVYLVCRCVWVRGQNPRRTKSLADKIPAIWSARTKSPQF